MKTVGFATAAATERYNRRFDARIAPGHFRQSQGLWLSSIGLGTYLGNHDDETDRLYRQAIVRAVDSGCNVIDSAINTRIWPRSSRTTGLERPLGFQQQRLREHCMQGTIAAPVHGQFGASGQRRGPGLSWHVWSVSDFGTHSGDLRSLDCRRLQNRLLLGVEFVNIIK
jgi:hypothetical protein